MTTEHAYQWKKFKKTSPEIAEKIMQSGSPNLAKKIKDEYSDLVDPAFGSQKALVMKEILLTKTMQHEKVQKMLKASQGKVIIENSPEDNLWGIGDGTGQNLLGKIWMEVREEIL